MKIRTDFVTNSSSSNYVIARRNELTEKQREIIFEFAKEFMMGKKVLSPQTSEAELKEYFAELKDAALEKKIRKALKEGKSIYRDDITLDETIDRLMSMHYALWRGLYKTSRSTFLPLDIDLSY